MMRLLALSATKALALLRARDGVSAVEFAAISPVFVVILAGMIDIGGALHSKFQLNAAVSAGSSYALTNPDSVSAEHSAALAEQIAAVLASGMTAETARVTVTVNNGPTLTLSDGAAVISGAPANANQCYCPQRSGNTIQWGGGAACGAACGNGGSAGKFVWLSAGQSYTPMFNGYGIAEDDGISVSALVRTE